MDDTPNQNTNYRGCPQHPQTSCNSTDMFMNYMDYTDCVSMFTNGQKEASYSTFEELDNRASFIEYQNNKARKFIASIYFIVNDKTNEDPLSCGYRDEPKFGIIDLNNGFDSDYEIIPCIQYTKNGNVDPIIDIEVVDDGDCTDPFTNYFVNTNLNYDRWFGNMTTNICYTKGEKTTECKDKIINIGFFESRQQVTDSNVHIYDGKKCKKWTLVLFDINRGIEDKCLYLGYQTGHDLKQPGYCDPLQGIYQIIEHKTNRYDYK